MSSPAPAQTTAIVTTSPGKKPGRPKAHVDISKVFELASQGYSMADVARHLGVSERLCWQKCHSDPEFKKAYDGGLDDIFNLATRTLRQLILEKNLGAICFLLRNKFHWVARGGTDITVKHEVAIPTIDGHVLEMAAYQSALLDAPDPDLMTDAEFSEVFNLEEAMR